MKREQIRSFPKRAHHLQTETIGLEATQKPNDGNTMASETIDKAGSYSRNPLTDRGIIGLGRGAACKC